jgi:two-component system sensor histidine kinase HydH
MHGGRWQDARGPDVQPAKAGGDVVTRAQIGVVLAVVALALALTVVVGSGVRERDRRAIHEGLAQVRRQRLEVAATELTNDIEKIADDLALSLALVASADDSQRVDRDFRAITAIAREYQLLALWDAGEVRVARSDPPATDASDDPDVAAAIEAALSAARRHPGRFHASPEVRAASWLRVFALADTLVGGRAVAIVVDMREILAKLRLLRGPDSALLVLGGDGVPQWVSDAAVARAASPNGGDGLGRFIGAARDGRPVTTTVDRAGATAIGLPAAAAVAVSQPVDLPGLGRWTLALVTSTVNLRNQERVLVGRMVAAVGLMGTVLGLLTTYIIRTIRRSTGLRERLRHLDTLAHLNDKADKILDHIPSGVMAVSEQGELTAVNARLRGRFGGACGERLEVALRGAPAAEVGALLDLVAEARSAGAVRSRLAEDCSLFGQRGRYHLHAVPLERRLPDVHMLIVAEDLRAVQELEGQLLHSEKLATLGVLAAGIAHEIGTPLNIARGWAERARQQSVTPVEQAEINDIVIEQIDHVTGLMGQLLDFVRPQSVAVVDVDVAAAVAGTVALLGPEAHRRGVLLTPDVAEGLPPILADAAQFQQVVVNLTVNALDSCERGGHVVVRAMASDEPGHLRVEVVDDGCGIARVNRNRIFDPFFTTKKRGRGTGLGLSVVDQLVRSHRGHIEVASEEGQGTRVRVSWPVSPDGAREVRS